MAAAEKIFVDSDMNVEVTLRGTVSGNLISTATVTAELLDLSDVQITGATNPFTLAAVAGTAGLYRGNLSNAFDTVANTSYKLKIVANAGAGLLRTIILTVEARES